MLPPAAASPEVMRRGLTAYGDEDFSLFLRKAFIKAMGYTDDALERPIIGITNTFSGFNACHRNVPELIDAVKRGVMLAGGLPVEFPVITLHESFAFPTSMYLRNMSPGLAYNLVKAVFDHKADIVASHKEADNISLENQRNDTSPIPFHPGAIKYFSEKGIKVR